MNLNLLRISYLFVFSMLLSTFISAQESASLSTNYSKNSKVLYRTILLKDAIVRVVINIDKNMDFQYEYWEGDAILIEQEIQLANAPNSIFKALLRKNRYKVTELFESDALVLKYEGIKGKDILINDKNIEEKIFLKLLVPKKLGVELQQG